MDRSAAPPMSPGPPASAAHDLNRRILKSEESFVQMLSMLQHLFLEPVVPLPNVQRVFVNVEQVCEFHSLLWRQLEPLLESNDDPKSDKESAGNDMTEEDVLQECVMEIYRYSAFWTVYISFFMTHDAAQHQLKDLMRTDEKFALLARDAAILRPQSSLQSCLQLIRARPWQMRRYLLHAAGVLSAKEFAGRYRRGVFAARGAARQLLQVTETSRLEHLPFDRKFLVDLAATLPRTNFFSHSDCCILWKGAVQVGLDGDCRLVVCYDRMLLLRRANHFWSTTTYEIVGQWILNSSGSSSSRISGTIFSAREVGSGVGKDSPMLYGVHIETSDGIDWRVILSDKLATTVLLSAVKEMHTELDQRAGKLYNVTLALEAEDVWNAEMESGALEPPREYLGRSPEELKQTLRDLRMQYEFEGAIVIDSDATKALRRLGGRDGFLQLLMPVMTDVACLSSNVAFVACCADIVVSGSFRENEDDWLPSWKQAMAEYLETVTQDTYFATMRQLLLLRSSFFKLGPKRISNRCFGSLGSTVRTLSDNVIC